MEGVFHIRKRRKMTNSSTYQLEGHLCWTARLLLSIIVLIISTCCFLVLDHPGLLL
jgi:hypothetical protein